ncbi:winged helix-turn-helix domain-containing protein [Furfurilactobacillus entadae]|uniref:winged helix-turn-helix domain-containing protein n=1 Tax=Furfurilactobacillus entadae TaxID=2922307 RepID=UPI0035E84C5E
MLKNRERPFENILAANMMLSEYKKILKSYGLTISIFLVGTALLQKNYEPSKIVKSANVSSAVVSQSIKYLFEKELATQFFHNKDRRAHYYKLTDQGEQLISEVTLQLEEI